MRKHLFVLLILLLGLHGCAAPPPPLLADLVAAPSTGAQTMVAILYRDDQGARLVSSLSVSADRPVPLDPPEQQVWLGGLDPPANLNLREQDGVQYGLVVAQGAWLPAGQYGPGGRWLYALDSPRLQPIVPETVDLASLLRDRRYQQRIVRVTATLIVSSGASLLVDEVGLGGIPSATALQIKLTGGDRDQAALDRLQRSGPVHYGPVEVIGRWQAGRLEPLLIIPR